jgi:hypothetical protein
MTGFVVYLNRRGFGRVRAGDGGVYFFAAAGVERSAGRPFDHLRVADRVAFELAGGEAVDVRWIDDGPMPRPDDTHIVLRGPNGTTATLCGAPGTPNDVPVKRHMRATCARCAIAYIPRSERAA